MTAPQQSLRHRWGPRRVLLNLAPGLGLALFLGVWEGYVRIFDVRPLILPAPSRVLRHVAGDLRFYADNAAVTALEATLGLTVAFVAAMIMATAMAHSPLIERSSWPVIVLIQSTPVVVLAPVFLRWFGFGLTPKVMVAALFAFVPLVSNALSGLKSIDDDRLDLLRSVNASTVEIFWRLRLPSALPALFAAGRICISLALVGAVVGELYGASTRGLGHQTRVAFSRLLVDQQWGSIFVLSFMGIVATLVLLAIERRVLRWHTTGTGS